MDWKEEAKKRKDFIRLHDDIDSYEDDIDEDYAPRAHIKNKAKKPYCLEVFMDNYPEWGEDPWFKFGSYEKLQSAEQAANNIHKKDYVYKGRAMRIMYKGEVIKEYPKFQGA